MRAGMTGPYRDNIPQGLPGTQPGIKHDAELRPSGLTADLPVSIITPYNLLKPVAWNHPEQWMKNRVIYHIHREVSKKKRHLAAAQCRSLPSDFAW